MCASPLISFYLFIIVCHFHVTKCYRGRGREREEARAHWLIYNKKTLTAWFDSIRSFEWLFSCMNTSSFICTVTLFLSSLVKSPFGFPWTVCTSSPRFVSINDEREKSQKSLDRNALHQCNLNFEAKKNDSYSVIIWKILRQYHPNSKCKESLIII